MSFSLFYSLSCRSFLPLLPLLVSSFSVVTNEMTRKRGNRLTKESTMRGRWWAHDVFVFLPRSQVITNPSSQKVIQWQGSLPSSPFSCLSSGSEAGQNNEGQRQRERERNTQEMYRMTTDRTARCTSCSRCRHSRLLHQNCLLFIMKSWTSILVRSDDEGNKMSCTSLAERDYSPLPHLKHLHATLYSCRVASNRPCFSTFQGSCESWHTNNTHRQLSSTQGNKRRMERAADAMSDKVWSRRY